MPGPLPPAYPLRRSLADVMPTAASVLGVPGYADALGLGEAASVTVLLVDGLGDRQISADVTPFMTAHRAQPLSCTFPSTTPVGLGSLGTGMPAGGHGLVGGAFVVPETGRVLEPLHWTDDPHPTATQPEPTVLERAARAGVSVATISPREYERSGLTRSVLRGADYRGADSAGERVGELAAALRSARERRTSLLAYVYWALLDRTGHGHGVDSVHWRAEARQVDRLVEQCAGLLGPGDVLVVTADHGMVDCLESDRIWVDDDRSLTAGVAILSGEPRMRHVYVRDGAAADVAAAWRGTLADRAWVLTREEAIESGWFGDVEPDYQGRLGDVLAVARDRTVLASRRVDERVSRLIGQHGALTDEEMTIPWVVVRGGTG